MSSGTPTNSIYANIRDGLSAGVSAVEVTTLKAPIDRVKLLLQLQHANPYIKREDRYKGIINCFRRVYKEQGFLSLWRGNVPSVLRYFPATALGFALNDSIKRMFPPADIKTDRIKALATVVATGATAGAATLTVVYPFDFARTRLALDVGAGSEREFKGMIDCLSKIYKSDGIRGWYRGAPVSILGIVVYRAVYFGGYDTGRKLFFPDPSKRDFRILFALAHSITILSAVMAYPIDTISRSLQMQSGRNDPQYKSSFGCIKHILKKEGMRGLYGGFTLHFLAAFGGALGLVMYDSMKKSYQ